MNKNNECDLKSCLLCKLCLKDWLPAIGAHKKNFYVKKGQQIFKEGDPVTGIYFIYSGIVKVHKRWDKEKELIIRFAKKGDIIGHLALGDSLVYPISATALEAGVVCYVDMDFFESTLKVNADFTFKLLMIFANQLQESEKRMRNLAHMSVKGRVAQSLLTLRSQFGLNDEGFIDIELTRQDLSSFTGATYETLFKVINELVQDKTIKLDGKAILISNEKQLLKLIEEADK